VTSSGKVWERLSQQGAIYYAYGAEMLRVLRRLPPVAAGPGPSAPPASGELAAVVGTSAAFRRGPAWLP